MSVWFVLVLDYLLFFYSIALTIWVLASWFPRACSQKWYSILSGVITPVLKPLRSLIPPIGGVIDVSPLIALLLLQFLQTFLISFIRRGP